MEHLVDISQQIAENSNCKRRNFRKSETFRTQVPSKTFRRAYSEIDQKKKKKRKLGEATIERPANQVEENLVWKLISYIFQINESYEIKFHMKMSSFTVT